MNLYPHILGCLLGTAVGDAVGLRREGLSAGRAMRMYGGAPLRAALVFGRGFCSDDTEHTMMVARALTVSGGEVAQFELSLAADLKRWLLTMPAGVGFATLRACLKLLVGFGPRRSGVFSAGNGPAMRSALIGICAQNEGQLKCLVEASTRITHTDPMAEEGALLVARAARVGAIKTKQDSIDFIHAAVSTVQGRQLGVCLDAAAQALRAGHSCVEFANSQGWAQGVSGFVNQTVPAALYCWARSPNNFRQCVEDAVMLGGDTDSVAAIAGAICGANLGADAIPQEWINSLAEWPRTVKWIEQLAEALVCSVCESREIEPPSMRWLATIPRNIMFASVVISLGLRRLLPPY